MTTPLGRIAGFLGLALLSYLLLCLLVAVFQRKVIYFPWRWDASAARAANPGYEEVLIPTSDGEKLHGWLHRRRDASWTVVIFHGNAGNLSVQESLMTPFLDLGLQVLLFDYRGFGLSSGTPTEKGLIEDGKAVVRFLETELQLSRQQLVYFGKSLGTGVAVQLAARQPPARLILESAFDSLASVGQDHYFFLPVRWLMRDRFDVTSVISDVACPILFFHAERDEIISPRRGKKLFSLAPEPKKFVILPNARHNDPPQSFPSIYQDSLREFLDLSLDGESGERGHPGEQQKD